MQSSGTLAWESIKEVGSKHPRNAQEPLSVLASASKLSAVSSVHPSAHVPLSSVAFEKLTAGLVHPALQIHPNPIRIRIGQAVAFAVEALFRTTIFIVLRRVCIKIARIAVRASQARRAPQEPSSINALPS